MLALFFFQILFICFSIILANWKTLFIQLHIYLVIFWICLLFITLIVGLFKYSKKFTSIKSQKLFFYSSLLILVVLLSFIIYWVSLEILFNKIVVFFCTEVISLNGFFKEKYRNISIGLKFLSKFWRPFLYLWDPDNIESCLLDNL